MPELLQDLRYGIRVLAKGPAATAISVLALSLGIGANSAIFSVMNAILIRPLPYQDSGHLVAVFENKLSQGMRRQPVSPLDYQSFAEQNDVFDGIGAIRSQTLTVTGRELPERIEGAAISPSIFKILGMHPALGRAFASDEDQPQKNSAVVISDGLWRRRFGGDANILGSPLVLDGKSYSVVGIAPPGFHLVDNPAELWIPYTPNPVELTPYWQGLRVLKVLAHLKAGVSPRQAEIGMQAIARGLEKMNPGTNAGYGAEVIPLQDQVVGNIGATLWILTGAVAFVLLIACANVANLLLARAGSRQKEIAIRSSLGANPARIVQQMLTESVLLALIGGAFGLALAYWGITAIVKFAPANIPRLEEISLDWRVLLFTLAISVITGVVFGLAPALASIRPDLNSVLRASGRSTTGNLRSTRMRDMLVIFEIAGCVVLVTAAGLLIRSLARLQQVDPGFRADHVLTMEFALPKTLYPGLKVASFYKQLLDRVQRLPGVQSAGICRYLPMSGPDVSLNFHIEGQPLLAVADQPRAKFRAASGGYFTALGIHLIRGRVFNASDGEHTPKVVVINAATAERYWHEQDPVGRRILSGNDDNAWSTIIGVVANVKHAGLDAETSPETYYDYQQIPADAINFAESVMYLAIRTGSDPAAMTSAVRNELRAVDPDQPVFNVRTMDQVVESSIAQPRFRTLLLGIFASLALVLAAIGLYGVMSYSVTQRINELGVRVALGAQPSQIWSLVVGRALGMACIGVGIGLIIASLTTWTLSRLLFGVRAMDVLTFFATCVLTMLVALVASSLPALRAIRVDPAVALRAE
ncbi:MAG TPA: ABC transporter permease [Bryobacteraceae bacterium]|nr:ABC transporter permease [Bryobacteraceae bacterium]